MNTKIILLATITLASFFFIGAASLKMEKVQTQVHSTEIIFMENGEYMVVTK